eukprot:6203163-Pleurochrysis_carterae.AAC.1
MADWPIYDRSITSSRAKTLFPATTTTPKICTSGVQWDGSTDTFSLPKARIGRENDQLLRTYTTLLPHLVLASSILVPDTRLRDAYQLLTAAARFSHTRAKLPHSGEIPLSDSSADARRRRLQSRGQQTGRKLRRLAAQPQIVCKRHAYMRRMRPDLSVRPTRPNSSGEKACRCPRLLQPRVIERRAR